MVHSRPSCSSNKAITPSCDGDTTVIVYVPSPPLPGAPPYNNPPPPCASNNFPKPSILPKNPSPSSSSDTPISSSTLPNNTPPPSSVDTYPLLPGNISYNPDFYPIKHLLPPNYHPPSTTLPGTTFPSQEYPVQIPEYPPIPSWLPPNNSSSTTLPETTFPSQEYPLSSFYSSSYNNTSISGISSSNS
ncbi:hypothetical protein HMI56_002854 [Coelomomyces lativittatus]|nr:hypothetical protein HMI56_002854 [Coelomomyces lativittatus]